MVRTDIQQRIGTNAVLLGQVGEALTSVRESERVLADIQQWITAIRQDTWSALPNIVGVPHQRELDTLREEVERLAARLERAEQVVINIGERLQRMTPSFSDSATAQACALSDEHRQSVGWTCQPTGCCNDASISDR